MNYYIADTHFGHEASIRFDNRPFCSVEENDRTLIENWNARVTNNDHIYGHIHNGENDIAQFMYSRERALNAGCMLNGYMPVTFEELVWNRSNVR